MAYQAQRPYQGDRSKKLFFLSFLFKIENKAKQSHKGDFHLFFKDFNVLVDSKNYTTSISKKEIVKIESDLNTNSNMNFAWLVSLNSNILTWLNSLEVLNFSTLM